MTLQETVMKYRAEILLGAILLLSAFLNFWNVWNQGYFECLLCSCRQEHA